MKYAYFDSITRKVLGWLDTEAFEYELPDASALIELSATDWEAHANSERWVTPDMALVSVEPETTFTLERARSAKLSAISRACASEITSGFDCSALGEACRYPSDTTDQANLTASVLASLLAKDPDWSTPFWCYDASGTGAFVAHTASQIQEVGTTGIATINAVLAKKGALEYQIQQAKTAKAIDAINW